MRISAGSRPALLTYCTNVHPADDAAGLIAALDETTASVAASISPREAFGLGLRLGEDQVREIEQDRSLRSRLEDVFARRNFFAFTINGFPQGRFSAWRVKHSVYRPDWTDPARTRYTLDLARLLAGWLPKDDPFGTISTLPIGWRPDVASRLPLAARELSTLATALSRIEEQSGARIMVCLEPEPGCVLETMAEVVAFFEQHLLPAGDAGVIRRHIGVCYDACHQAVLFEDHEAGLTALAQAGIKVGKVQLSSALSLDFTNPDGLAALVGCDEERFLHQVAVRCPKASGFLRRFTDLPDLRHAILYGDIEGSGEARCHFHVPIHAAAFPPLLTTQAELLRAISAVVRLSDVRHFEVETYTFHVLPAALRASSLADDLAKELAFARTALTGGG